jgi:hypothetical protein
MDFVAFKRLFLVTFLAEVTRQTYRSGIPCFYHHEAFFQAHRYVLFSNLPDTQEPVDRVKSHP